jgi:hypothetical protein
MLISLYKLSTARKLKIVKEKERKAKLEEIQLRSRARVIHMKEVSSVSRLTFQQ